MKQKKGKFWTLVFSFLPGAAEMYMGFMKKGISIMAVFFASLIVPYVLRVGDIFILLAVLVWFYAFFHARNLTACSEELFQEIQDDYIWRSFGSFGSFQISNPTLRKWGAVILIIYGLSLLWQTVSEMFYYMIPEHLWNRLAPMVDAVPQIAVAILIIAVGVKLIAGKKEEMNGKGE